MLPLAAPSSLTPATTENTLSAVGELLPKPPPTPRDFAVFHRSTIEGKPTRDVAWQFEISQTRVCQIVKRVRVWLWEVLPELTGQPATERQVQLARALAADRLEHLYQEALHAWQASLGQRQTTRRVGNGPLVMTSQSTSRDARYLTAAGRIALLQARLGLPSGILTDAQAELTDENIPEPHPFIGQESLIEPEASQQPHAVPPSEDCSATSHFCDTDAGSIASDNSEIALPNITCEQLAASGCHSDSHFHPPVHPAHHWHDKSTVLATRVTPEIAGCELSLPSSPQ